MYNSTTMAFQNLFATNMPPFFVNELIIYTNKREHLLFPSNLRRPDLFLLEHLGFSVALLSVRIILLVVHFFLSNELLPKPWKQ